MEKRVCWTMEEILLLVQRLLEDKQEVMIKTRKTTIARTDNSWIVEWQLDRELRRYR